MRASSRSRLFAAFGVLVVVVAVAIAGCAAGAATTRHSVSKQSIVYRANSTYRDVKVFSNLTYSKPGGVSQKLDVCLPPAEKGETLGARPAILVIHGGSWAHGDKSLADWHDVCRWLASSGFVAAAVDYRLSPKYRFPDAIHDVEHAVEWLREPAQVRRFAIDPTLIGAFGGSAGGNLAALLGTTGKGSLDTGHRVAAVAELSGPANLTTSGKELANFIPYERQYLNCHKLTQCPDARLASPLYHVDPSDPPFFIGHSLNERIPLVQSEDLVWALRASGIEVTFRTVPGHLHSIAMLNSSMRSRIAAFFHAKLVHTPVGTDK